MQIFIELSNLISEHTVAALLKVVRITCNGGHKAGSSRRLQSKSDQLRLSPMLRVYFTSALADGVCADGVWHCTRIFARISGLLDDTAQESGID